jgi:hypothetical protein
MLTTRFAFAAFLAALALLALAAPASAQSLDILQGKYGFNWRSNPDRAKCEKIDGKLFDEFKSAKYKCELKEISNTASGEKARVCTAAKNGKATKDGKEYLIFATFRSCEKERKDQASNE